MINNYNARLVFNNALQAMANAGYNVKLYKLTQSFLRLEQPMVAGRTNYNFPIMINQQGQNGFVFNTEQRLNLQDSFVCSQVRFYLAQPSSQTDVTFPKLTYPNPDVFTDEATARTLNAFYSGLMTISVNNNVLVTAWDLDRHKYVPQTQQTAAWGAGSPLDEYDGSDYGLYPMEPNIVFVGSKNNVLQIQLPEAPDAVPANARIGIEFKGILAQNSTVVS